MDTFIAILPRPYKELLKTILLKYFPVVLKNHPKKIHWQIGQEFSGHLLRRRIFKFYGFWMNSKYKVELQKVKMCENTIDSGSIAVHLHVYYIDVFEQILVYFKHDLTRGMTIFITYPFEIENQVLDLTKAMHQKTIHIPVENRGRDVSPFLNVFQKVVEQKFSLLIKIHTKKSNWKWAEDLFKKLLLADNLSHNIKLFEKFENLGVLVPQNHVLPMGLYYGENSGKVKELSSKMGATKAQLNNLHFAAGTMFVARPEAIVNILELGFTSNDFELETGQPDGTLAHAMERIFCLCAELNGFHFADTGSTVDTLLYTVTPEYKYV